MQPSTSTEEPANGNGSCSTGPQPQPCACCTALAQLRMPWMDVAMQHAPHYPYGYQPRPGVAAPAYQADEEEDDPAAKTVFFKLPDFGKKNAKNKKVQSGGGRHSGSAGKGKVASAEVNLPGSKKKKIAYGDGLSNESETDDESVAATTSTDSPDSQSEESSSENTDWVDDKDLKETKKKLNFGVTGLAVSVFGIASPAFLLAASILSTPKRITLVTLHHPVETVIELLLVASIPLVNFLVWSAISKNRANLSRWMIMGLGSALGTALVVAGFSFACLFSNHEELMDAIGSDFSMGFTWLGMCSLLSAAVSAYLANRLRTSWELQSTRMKVTIQAVIGMVLAMVAFAGSEYRPWTIRMAQYNAVSKNEKVRVEGLKWLRQLNPEREMRMECSDSKAAGLAGLFFPIKPSTQQQLYFTLTGTPYSFRDMNAQDLSSMPDDYLSRHVVGDKIPQLDLTRSTLNGTLHANTLTSTLNWTFVVRNGSSQPQEMRAEIGLPAGAAITGLTVWSKGEPEDSEFVASGNKLDGITTTAGHETPAMITDMGHGRVLLHCSPVPKEEELKVRVSMVVPLRSESDGQASLVTPQLIASNFDLEGEHVLRLRSQSKLTTNAKGLEGGTNPSGESVISGTLSSEQLESSPLLISARRDGADKPYAVLDKLAIILRREDEREAERLRVQRERIKEQQRKEQERAEKEEMGKVVLMIDGTKAVPSQIQDLRKMLADRQKHEKDKKTAEKKVVKIKPEFTVEDIASIAAPAPKHLVVVIDGSAAMKGFTKDLYTAFSHLPASIPTSVIIASQESEKSIKAQELAQLLPNLQKIEFAGGQDNLKAVIQAAELAGETKDSAVLWIHGPQPVINQEIYIMSPYESQPAFYELPVVAGTDTFEFFKNHAEIGPFTQVPRNGSTIASDLSDFFSRWNPKNNSAVASLSESQTMPNGAVEPRTEEGKELIMLHAVQECNKLIASRHFHRAARIATRYGFVSAVSSAFLGANHIQVKDADTNPVAAQQAADAAALGNSNTLNAATEEIAVASNGDVVANSGHYTGSQTQQGYSADAFAGAPQLQGATNGTIGPQGSDATVIMGVNTAGTVRVNNLANLEALLNIIANLGELGAVLSGIGLFFHGVMNKAVMKLGEDIELGPGGRMIIGGILIFLGLILPGVINWFVASARDANLFS